MKMSSAIAKWLLLMSAMLQAPNIFPQNARQIFEVASVRMSESGCANFAMSPPDSNQFFLRGATMLFVVGMAYHLDGNNIRANQKGFDSRCFDISAKGQGDTRLSPDDARLGLQQLLADRFALRFHRAQQEQQGYDLEVDGAGIALPPSKGGPASGSMTTTSLHARNFPMRALAGLLARIVGKPVADKTQLKGQYDIDLKFSSDVASAEDEPSIFRALQKELGLRLKPAKVSVDLFFVDSVRQEPTDEMAVGS
jgi:uncharacterized protein (TIGR03435 family)